MTHRRQSRALGPIVILSRLVVALALTLFGAQVSQAERLAARSGPNAESLIDQADGIFIAQRQILRAYLPADDAPDAAGQGAATLRPVLPAPERIAPAEVGQVPVPGVRALPPVRGPPAV